MAKYFVGSILLAILILFFDTPQSPRKKTNSSSVCLSFPVVKGSGSFGRGLPIHEALMLAPRLSQCPYVTLPLAHTALDFN